MNPNDYANQVIETCGSTSDLAKELGAQGYPHGTWVSSRSQEMGRGRRGRGWISARGNLFLSLLLRPEPEVWKSFATWIPLTVASGVLEGLKESIGLMEPQIKWPNDLFFGGIKLGGVLCEGVATAEERFVVAGIGLNCVSAPDGLDQPTTSLSLALEKSVSADDIRSPVIQSVLRQFKKLEVSGSLPIRETYEAHAFFKEGDRVSWANSSDLRQQEGIVLGLGSFGELIVKTNEGREMGIYADDVRRIRPDVSQ